MAPPRDLSDLEAQRSALHDELAQVGDFRPGSLSAVMRRCGKANCVCADPAHLGHGPQHVLTKKVDGKTVSVHLRAGANLDKVAAEVANYKRFKDIVGGIVSVSESICEARPASPLPANRSPEPEPAADAEKRGSARLSARRSRRR